MHKNKKKKRKVRISFVIAGIVIAGITVFTIFFNGKGLFFTFGMSKGDVLSVGSGKMSAMSARVLISDEKKDMLEIAGEDILKSEIKGESLEKYIKNNVEGRLSRVAALNNMAREKGVVLSHVQRQDAAGAASVYYQALTDDEKRNLNADLGELEEMFKQFKLAEEMHDYLIADSVTEVSTDEARVISILYICCSDEQRAMQAHDKLKKGEPFYDVAAQYSEDEEYTAELKKGDTSKSFEDAAFNLASGELSDVVNAQDKFYVIKCSSDNEQSKTDANRENILAQRKNEYFEELFLPYENEHYIEKNNALWNKINVSDIMAASVKFDDIYRQYIN